MKKIVLIFLLAIFTASTVFSQFQNISVNGTNREYLIHVPSNLGSNRPLMISLHGMNQDAPFLRSESDWESVADTAKFIVVYPNGLNRSWSLSGNTDINLILALIDEMYSRYSIDKDRVYLSGFSMGGMMTYYSATQIADRIAAFAPVSGYLMQGPNTNSSRPIPIIHTHGTGDDVVGYNGVSTCMNAWATRNEVVTPPIVTSPYPSTRPGSIADMSYWQAGAGEVEMVLMTLNGKGHHWSLDPAGVHTSAEIWKFVSKYDVNGLIGSSSRISFTSPTSNNFVAPATVLFDISTSDFEGQIERIDFYINNETTPFHQQTSAPYSVEHIFTEAGTYTIRAVATANDGNFTENTVTITVNPAQAPYNAIPASIPGKIEFEHYDIGGNGYAYFDTSDENTGGADYRMDEDVDLEDCDDEGNGYNLGWTVAGEWLEYTVNVTSTGIYNLTFRVACDGTGRTISLSSNGNTIANNIAIPNTEGWQEWTDVIIEDVELNAGEQVLRLTIGDTDYVNLNYMTFTLNSATVESIQLLAGWNLIGSPIDGSTDIDIILSSIWDKVELVKNMDSYFDKNQSVFLNSLTQLNWGEGYWVKVDEDCELIWRQ